MKKDKKYLRHSGSWLATALLALCTAAGSPLTARADLPGVSVPHIHITNLRSAAGHYLNAYYVSAREASFGVQGQQLKFFAILSPVVRIRISSSGEVDLPAVTVPRDGFRAFDYLYIAITGSQPNPLLLRNVDGTPIKVLGSSGSGVEPADEPALSYQVESSAFVSKFRLASPSLPRVGGAVQIDAMQGVFQQ